MDCKTARLLLDYARPSPAELSGGDAAALESHLVGCPDCETLAHGERQLDDHLGRAVREVPLPPGVRDRLLQRLQRERRVRYLRRTVRIAAAAALVLLGLGMWQFWPRPALPAPDLDALVEYISQNDSSRQSPEKVDDWFHANHPDLPMIAPREFDQQPINYDYLTYSGLDDFQGQRIPLLLFERGSNHARVFVLSRKQFKIEELLQGPLRMNSKGYMVAVCPCPDDAGLVYVFIFTGDTMAPFLNGAPAGIG
jgi:hypothetical protein